jgi:peptidoglycan/LPS O-acetylase OafA/YrhL
MIAVDPRSALASTDRFPCFDGLRALAALGVLVLHVSLISGYSFRHEGGLAPYFARGEVGVYLFFLISGYLLYRPFVAARLDHAPLPDVRAYARRRLLRIVPAYWVALTVLIVVFDTRRRADVSSVKDVIVYYGFLQIYFKSTVVGGLQQAWSLCTEMSFYVFLPLWALAMQWTRRHDEHGDRAARVEIGALVALFAVGLLSRWLVVQGFTGHVDVDRRLDWLPANADLFALGMAVAVVREWSLRRPQPLRALEFVGRQPGLCWALAAVSYWAISTQAGMPRGPGADSPRQWMVRQLLYASTSFFLLLPAVFGHQDQGLVRRFLRARVVVLLGTISYGIYLWHEGVLDVWMHARDIPPFGSSFGSLLAVTLAGTITAAALSYVIVERPALARKTARRPSPAST